MLSLKDKKDNGLSLKNTSILMTVISLLITAGQCGEEAHRRSRGGA